MFPSAESESGVAAAEVERQAARQCLAGSPHAFILFAASSSAADLGVPASDTQSDDVVSN